MFFSRRLLSRTRRMVQAPGCEHPGACPRRWVSLSRSRTLTKGLVTHPFRVQGVLRQCVEKWLNTPENEGGRPTGPSPFLLPSATADNGQMSPSTLTRIFADICDRAGFRGDPRAHLHAMRHSSAHRLARQGNQPKQISVFLGHKSVAVTTEVYLRDDVETVYSEITLPNEWNGAAAPTTPEATSTPAPVPSSTPPPTDTGHTKGKGRPSTKEMMERALAILENA